MKEAAPTGQASATAGLTTEAAAELLRRYGPNQLPDAGSASRWRRLLAEFVHFFALLLWGASGLAFIAGMPQLGIAILVVVIINGVFAYIQEERAEHAAAKLRALLPAQVLVRRDGESCRIPARDLVPGDVVLLTGGDRIPADVRLVVVAGCSVDESMLTGESEPVAKDPGAPGTGGTFLVNGDAEGIVLATGATTRLARIAELAARVKRPPSPLNLELDRIVRTIAVVALIVGGGFFAVSAMIGIPWRDAFLFAIGVSVALIPEGLLPTVTLSLAMGAQRMAGRNALVRHLQAVETLGSTTFICTDKTGTLTQNRMSAVELWTPAGTVRITGSGYDPQGDIEGTPAATGLARLAAGAAALASRGRTVFRNEGWQPDGDPMEAALDALAGRLQATRSVGNQAGMARAPFTPARRRESVLVGTRLSVKGAPETVLPLCTGMAAPAGSGTVPIDPDAVGLAIERMASEGLRLLAVAGRDLPSGGPAGAWGAVPAEGLESELILLGLIGLHDPPRPTVAAALREARLAGVKVAMLTGDHPSTAAAIAREIGLSLDQERLLDGQHLPLDELELGELLDHDGVVVSRVTPEQKLLVARALQRRGHVLAMTGDGVNDGPALREADVGVAMGVGGTDVARDAADLVLLDDDFSTIIAAIEQGRATYANIRRFLTYHLTDNVAELTPFVIWALSGGSFPLALGVLQILALDIGTDLLPALALGSEKAGPGVMRRPPERRHLMDRPLLIRVFAILGPVEALTEMMAFTLVLYLGGWFSAGAQKPGPLLLEASGTAFAAVVLGQLANAYACRSATRPPWKLGWTGNRMMLWAVLAESAALLFFLYVPPLAAILGQAPPSLAGAAAAVLAIPAVFAADFLHKVIRGAGRRGNGPGA
ncbi:cation-translocating P-type ATPase [Arthrobacter silvisoli]|uniref:cation-translocating P-type ATPase n=1 Tax=Arthrobacter silvisoli TaxID=2291022 RepID=UPI000E219788|nr:cation-transporting P-type ATPase [Arthrobacter silvisoli]